MLACYGRIVARFSRNWTWFLGLALILGVILRMIFVEDMEYKEDEEYNFIQTQLIGVSRPWPWFGMPSGVYLVNPGMSIWVFTALAKVFQITDPLALAHAVQIFALFGMALVLPLVYWFVSKEEQKTWLWGFALAMVNPFLVFYQRKLWPEPFLPFFSVLTLMGWFRRSTRWGATLWGLMGALSGQVHMSGFFFSAALFLWTVLFDRKRPQEKPVRWVYWFLGSLLGALPLIPWLIYVVQHPVPQRISAGWEEISQLKYWMFWLTDATGLHLGNPLGLLRGNSNWNQISDFVRYPVIAGRATYLCGVAHAVVGAVAVGVMVRGLVQFLGVVRRGWGAVASHVVGTESETAFVQNSIFVGCGLLLTLTGVVIRRFYMAITFPLEFLFFVRLVRPETRWGHRLLVAVWIGELVISACFVGYVHVHEGALEGDYGPAYHVIQKQRDQINSERASDRAP